MSIPVLGEAAECASERRVYVWPATARVGAAAEKNRSNNENVGEQFFLIMAFGMRAFFVLLFRVRREASNPFAVPDGIVFGLLAGSNHFSEQVHIIVTFARHLFADY